MFQLGDPLYRYFNIPEEVPLRLSIKAYTCRMNLYASLQEVYVNRTNQKQQYKNKLMQYLEDIAASSEIDGIGYLLTKHMAMSNKIGNFPDYVRLEQIIATTRLTYHTDNDELDALLVENDILMLHPTDEEWEESYRDVIRLTFAHTTLPPTARFQRTDFYKIPFEFTPRQLSNRTHYIKKGYTWVHRRVAVEILVDVIGDRLTREYTDYQKRLEQQMTDEQDNLDIVIAELSELSLGIKETKAAATGFKRGLSGDTVVSPSELDVLRVPPCITKIQDSPAQFKYKARQTLSIFYSNLGMDVNATIDDMSKVYKPLHSPQWEKEYKPQVIYIMNKQYHMTSCATLANSREVGGCASSRQECTRKIRSLSGDDTLFINSPADYYRKAKASQSNKVIIMDTEIIPKKSEYTFKNDSFAKFINKH